MWEEPLSAESEDREVGLGTKAADWRHTGGLSGSIPGPPGAPVPELLKLDQLEIRRQLEMELGAFSQRHRLASNGWGVGMQGSQMGSGMWHLLLGQLGCGIKARHDGAADWLRRGLRSSCPQSSLPSLGVLRGDAPRVRGSHREPAGGPRLHPTQRLQRPGRPGS